MIDRHKNRAAVKSENHITCKRMQAGKTQDFAAALFFFSCINPDSSLLFE